MEGGFGGVVQFVILDAVRGRAQRSEHAKKIEWDERSVQRRGRELGECQGHHLAPPSHPT